MTYFSIKANTIASTIISYFKTIGFLDIHTTSTAIKNTNLNSEKVGTSR